MKYFLVAVCLSSAGIAQSTKAPTITEARQFLDKAEDRLFSLSNEAGRAAWVQSNFITDDTEAIAALANERAIAASVELAKEATRFDKVPLPEDLTRKMKLLKLSLTLAAPDNPKEREETTKLAASLEGAYGKGKYCAGGTKDESKCLDIPKELLDAWTGWHSIARPMKKDYARFVGLANKGARELGFADSGAMWRSKYDMAPDDFAKELDRLWTQVRPLYLSLHAYVRGKLREKYGDLVPASGPIPAHLLGNIWAQDWSNIFPLVAPADADPGFDLTKILEDRKTTPLQMVKYGEHFFSYL